MTADDPAKASTSAAVSGVCCTAAVVTPVLADVRELQDGAPSALTCGHMDPDGCGCDR